MEKNIIGLIKLKEKEKRKKERKKQEKKKKKKAPQNCKTQHRGTSV